MKFLNKMAILIKPILTEKATTYNDKGKFSFIVDKKANKVQVKKAVEKTKNYFKSFCDL